MLDRRERAPWIALAARLIARVARVAGVVGVAGALGVLGAASCTPEERNFGTGNIPPDGCKDAEACFDGLDNDCDGDVDCADAECDSGAVCVPSASNFALGVLVGADEFCPEEFTAEEELIHRGLSGGGCEGCACTPNPTDCVADTWYYVSEDTCDADVNQTGGVFYGPVGFECTRLPINNGNFSFGGVRVSTFDVIQTCTVTGAAAPKPATWTQSQKFCRASAVGTGCQAGHACVPRQEPKAQCALVSGSATCEGYAASQNDWFTGYTDSRSCSSCSCTASGGNCDNVRFELGNDYSCFDNIPVSQGDQWCGYAYSPPARLVGDPDPSSCAVDVSLTGSLDPTGQSTLCCLE